MKTFNIQLGDVVCCIKPIESQLLKAEVGQYYVITNIESLIQISTINEKHEFGRYAAIQMQKKTFFECFADKQNERKYKLNKLNKSKK